MEAMDFGSGVLDAEAPVDAGLSLILLPLQGMDLPAEGFLAGKSLPQGAVGVRVLSFLAKHPSAGYPFPRHQTALAGHGTNRSISTPSPKLAITAAGRLHHHRPRVLAPRDMDGAAVDSRAAGVGNITSAAHMGHGSCEHLADLLFSETVFHKATNQVHHLPQVIHSVSHMTSPAKAVPKEGYGTSAIEYVVPTMGR